MDSAQPTTNTLPILRSLMFAREPGGKWERFCERRDRHSIEAIRDALMQAAVKANQAGPALEFRIYTFQANPQPTKHHD